MTERSDCGRAREAIPELAAGALAGDERAEALRHLSGCAACRAELAEATRLVDAVTALAPAEEPPAGFEARVLARIKPRRRAKRWRSLALHLVTAAAVALGAVWVTAPDRELAGAYRSTLAVADGKYLTAAVLYSGRDTAGHAFAYQGNPSWVFLTVDRGAYRAQALGADGQVTDLGSFTGTSWGTALPMPVSQLAGIRLTRRGSPDVVAHFR